MYQAWHFCLKIAKHSEKQRNNWIQERIHLMNANRNVNRYMFEIMMLVLERCEHG